MKNLVQSKPFIAAGIVAVLCFGVLLVCILSGENRNFEFIPDDSINAAGPIESWTENATVSATEAEIEELVKTKIIILDDPDLDAIDPVPDDLDFVPDETTTFEPEPNTEIALTVMPEKPEPVERPIPDTAFRGERTGDATPEDVEAHKALDPKLTNPNVKPDGTPVTPKPAENTTQGGPVNGEEGIYFPGFGWIPYTGPNIVEESGSDGDWTKIIGKMG
ncbi:MAG: hypothetical protein FWD23_16575 [Oscillospiraceae bacterium]|nr:hypothetical protein [Oscillospiraceae bacterium]